MKKLFVGSDIFEFIEKEIYANRKNGLLYIADEVPPGIPKARYFDLTLRSIDPFKDMDYGKACDFIDVNANLFTAGANTLTRETGLEFIAEALDEAIEGACLPQPRPIYLNTLIEGPGKRATTGHIWAYNKMQRLLRSPVLKRVLCDTSHTKFGLSPTSVVLLQLDRSKLRDFDAQALAWFFIMQWKGLVIVQDGGFYLRDMHINLVREARLIAGVNFLDELPLRLRQTLLLLSDVEPHGALYDDAELLAKYAGLRPDRDRDDNDFNKYVKTAILRSD